MIFPTDWKIAEYPFIFQEFTALAKIYLAITLNDKENYSS
jgi:hypothetical protein